VSRRGGTRRPTIDELGAEIGGVVIAGTLVRHSRAAEHTSATDNAKTARH
jgi:hypothetical protein